MRAKRGIIGALVALAAVTGCAQSAESVEEPETLTASRAGGVYLDAVCPVNAAWDDVDLEVDRLRLVLARGDRDGSTASFAEAVRELGAVSEDAAEGLSPEAWVWPASAAAEVAAVRETLLADAEQAEEVADLPISEAASYAWPGATEAGAAASAARAALELPENPVTACAQWQEQRAAEVTPETTGLGVS